MNVGDVIYTKKELSGLPSGSIVESTEECFWSGRYAGVRWETDGDGFLTNLGDDNWGMMKTKRVVPIKYFFDPMPVKIVDVGE